MQAGLRGLEGHPGRLNVRGEPVKIGARRIPTVTSSRLSERLAGQRRRQDPLRRWYLVAMAVLATIGAIGFEGRRDYGAIGTVCNLSARLCNEAKSGQVLISQRVLGKADGHVKAEPVGELTLKGLHRPVPAYNVVGLTG